MNDRPGKTLPVKTTNTFRSTASSARRGAAAVECAIVAPLMVALVLGLMQSSYSIDATHKLYAAVRQAGRLASMDYSDRLQSGQTGNQKVISDIRNQLKAEGLPGDSVTVTITNAETGSAFNLDDVANNLKLFKIHVEVPFSTVMNTSLVAAPVDKLAASIVFRKGKTQLTSQ
jgi:Flp pilus assembly protein TadG